MLLRSESPIFVFSLENYQQIKQNYFRRQLYKYNCCECGKEEIARKDSKCLKSFLCKTCHRKKVNLASVPKIQETWASKYGSLENFYKHRQEAYKKTCKEKYGVDNVFQSEDVKDKIKQTSLTRYGVQTPGMSVQAREKQKQTMIQKYGVEYFSQNELLREKGNKTKLEKYGDKNYNNREKSKQTCLEKYGVDNSFKCEAVREKWQNNMLQRYGTTHQYFGHSFYKYEGVIFDSSWELIYFAYLKLQDIDFKYHPKRIPYFIDDKKHWYEPDFEVNGQLIEIKGPQFLKEGHLYNPFTCSFDKEKEQCMLDNDVIIISDISKMKEFVFSKLGNDFVKEHILGDKYE